VFVYDVSGRLMTGSANVQVWVSNPDTNPADAQAMVMMNDSSNWQTTSAPGYWLFPSASAGQPGLTPGQHAVEVIAQATGTCDGSDFNSRTLYTNSTLHGAGSNPASCTLDAQCQGLTQPANQLCVDGVCQVVNGGSYNTLGNSCTNLYGRTTAYVIGGGVSVVSVRLH
jgi:hypothetical protein